MVHPGRPGCPIKRTSHKATNTTNDTSQSNDQSFGAKAGIGIGAGIAGIIFLFILLLIFNKHRKRKQRQDGAYQDRNTNNWSPVHDFKHFWRSQLSGQYDRHELEGSHARKELETRANAAELNAEHGITELDDEARGTAISTGQDYTERYELSREPG